MMILAIDTSGAFCRAGVWRDGAMIAEIARAMPRGHAEALVPMIEELMLKAQVNYSDIARIAACSGPGSFTGLRVGLATAHGLALAAKIPAVGVMSTDVLAAAVPPDERVTADGQPRRILAVVDSKRGDMFAHLFDAAGNGLDGPAVVATADLTTWSGRGPVVVVGDGTNASVAAMTGVDVIASRATFDLGMLAALAATRPVDPAGPAPVYVRPPDITPDPGGGRLRP